MTSNDLKLENYNWLVKVAQFTLLLVAGLAVFWEAGFELTELHGNWVCLHPQLSEAVMTMCGFARR